MGGGAHTPASLEGRLQPDAAGVYTPKEVSGRWRGSGMQGAALAAVIGSLEQAGFGDALQRWLGAVARPDSVICLAFAQDGPPRVLLRQSREARVFARLEAGYLGGAYLLDPFHALHLRGAPEGAYRLRDVAPDAFGRSRYFQEYYRETTLLDEIAFVQRPAQGVTVMVCLGRDAGSGAGSGAAFSAAELAACRMVAPVVAALVARHGPWAEACGAAEASQGGVGDRLRAAAARRGIALTARQAEVALLVLRGHSTASVALALGVSPQTVKVFRRQLYARCAVSSQAELLALMLPLLGGPVSRAGR